MSFQKENVLIKKRNVHPRRNLTQIFSVRLKKGLLSELFLALILILGSTNIASADIFIENAGFENTQGQTTHNEFTFGVPFGWEEYDPNNLYPRAGVLSGTVELDGTDYFNDPAPDGDRVALLYNRTNQGDGEYGLQQTLSDTLQANTRYELSVQVGNIASGNGFNLEGFPGYRVELMAGGQVIALDNNLLDIPEAEFMESVVIFQTGNSHTQLGQSLGIRLVNLNVIPDGFTEQTSPDLEVDFDSIVLNSVAVPEPGSGLILCVSAIGMAIVRRRMN